MAPTHTLALATALWIPASLAFAETSDRPPFASPLTIDAVIATAQRAQPGEIVEFALDHFDGNVVIDVEVRTETGDEVEFKIDAQTGEILDVWTDDDPSDDPDEDVADAD